MSEATVDAIMAKYTPSKFGPGTYVCPYRCGCLVVDPVGHEVWHDNIAASDTLLRHLVKVLSMPVDEWKHIRQEIKKRIRIPRGRR